MLAQGWIDWILLLLFTVPARSLGPIPHQTSEESLRSALDAVVRKQRSLEPSSQDYYNDLRSFKYHGGDPERKFERERQGEPEIDVDDEEIEFLPSENGQLETVGNGFQSLNNKLLQRTLMDYSDNIPEQVEPVQSIFRERERSYSRKRGGASDRLDIDNAELTKLISQKLQDGSLYGPGNINDEEYLDALQMLSDRYRTGHGNKFYENEGPMTWSELLNREALMRAQTREANENDFMDRDQDQNVMYLSPTDRRNINGRYPIGRDYRNYRSMAKRYPISKRSPKSMPSKKQITDPKVAQDLGALFGSQPTEVQNHTHDHDHHHDHDHDHSHENHRHENSTEAPKVTAASKGQKENVTKVEKSKPIEVRKKSIDWSQYFGIDRRKKKATFMPGQGTQNQDDEWMLQRYYENMAANLRPSEQEYDNDEPSESRLRNIKDMIIEKELRHAEAEDNADLQKVKDKLMARMVAAYSLEKMRKALNDLRNNITIQKAAHAQNNVSSHFRDNGGGVSRTDDKRSSNVMEDDEPEESKTCPELEAIQRRCKVAHELAGDDSQTLYLPCVMLQICKACVDDDAKMVCHIEFAEEATKVCNPEDIHDDRKDIGTCLGTMLIVSQIQPIPAVVLQCHINGSNCLGRYYNRYRHRYLRYPYGGHRTNFGYENPQELER